MKCMSHATNILGVNNTYTGMHASALYIIKEMSINTMPEIMKMSLIAYTVQYDTTHCYHKCAIKYIPCWWPISGMYSWNNNHVI